MELDINEAFANEEGRYFKKIGNRILTLNIADSFALIRLIHESVLAINSFSLM